MNFSKWAKAVPFLMLLPLAGCVSHAIGPDPKNYAEAELTISSASTSRTVTLSEMSRSLPKHRVVVNDPVYQKVKRYEGFWLEDVLAFVNLSFSNDTTIVFSALDGYQARLTSIPGNTKPLLAFKDLDAPN